MSWKTACTLAGKDFTVQVQHSAAKKFPSYRYRVKNHIKRDVDFGRWSMVFRGPYAPREIDHAVRSFGMRFSGTSNILKHTVDPSIRMMRDCVKDLELIQFDLRCITRAGLLDLREAETCVANIAYAINQRLGE